METVVVTASASHGIGLSTICLIGVGVVVLAVIAWQARVRMVRHRG
jgi:hypothetical protein